MTTNPTQRDLISPIGQRWSPYRFDDRSVEPEKLAQCFEAASWAASSFNEQPWRWIVATREDKDAFSKMLGCLMEANQSWASHAGALVLTAFRRTFSRNENPNRVALHDLGQAAAHLALQATSIGLQVHQMGGVNLSQIRVEYQIPDEFEPATAIAIGYPDTSPPATEAEKSMAGRESAARVRQPLSAQVYTGAWGNGVKW